MIVFNVRFPVSFLFVSFLACALPSASADSYVIEPLQREFRAAWVATVNNIDWPSKPGLPSEQQKAELIAILDRAVRLKLNAIILQVRPACDAFYASNLEPWSEYLTGTQGKAPDPFYDPLAFAVEEAHRRGLELHAWFNPYRARHFTARSPLSPDHIARTRPLLVKPYGRQLWLDPGEREVQEHSTRVILDVVRRYDIDGVHIDDYFYPYKERDASGKIIPFPDEPSWQRYRKRGGQMQRDDWRRENVNAFVRRLYREIKAAKRWVKFGISPFGIWRPGYPPQISGFDQYAELYADARKWLREGWCDYFTPQLYWRIDQVAQSYPVLLKWWVEQNAKKRHIWAGNIPSRVADSSRNAWPPEEIVHQIRCTREQPGATGNVHFSMKALMQNRAGLADLLAKEAYSKPALVPASPWLDNRPPGKPFLSLKTDAATGAYEVKWEPTGKEAVWLWVVRVRVAGKWMTQVLPGHQTSLEAAASSGADVAIVSAVDRCGNESAHAVAGVKK